MRAHDDDDDDVDDSRAAAAAWSPPSYMYPTCFTSCAYFDSSSGVTSWTASVGSGWRTGDAGSCCSEWFQLVGMVVDPLVAMPSLESTVSKCVVVAVVSCDESEDSN